MTRMRTPRAPFGVGAVSFLIVIALVVGLAVVMNAVASGEPGTPVRPQEKTKSEIATQFADRAGPKEIVAPDKVPADGPTNPEGLRRYGPYRIVPADYHGPLPHTQIRPAPAKGVVSAAPSVVESSPLYVEFAVPSDMSRVALDTYDGDSNSVVRQLFAGADPRHRSLQVTRVVRSDEPIDVFEQPNDSTGWMQLRTDHVAGHEAIIITPTALSPIPAEDQLVRVQFFSDGIETILTATGMKLDGVMAVANSIGGQVK